MPFGSKTVDMANITTKTGIEKFRYYVKEWGSVAGEIFKWICVLWLLFPIAQFKDGGIQFARILLGILLFIIFAGKTFYDTIIMGMIKGRRQSLKRDILMLIGISLVAALIVGAVVMMVGFLIVEYNKTASSQNNGF